MSTIAIKESYVNTLRLFGEVDELLDEAVEQYLIDRVVERIKRARAEVQAFEKLYGTDYATFAERVQLDADYYNQVNQSNPLWEQDMLTWEYWDAEAQEWTEKLDDILSRSRTHSSPAYRKQAETDIDRREKLRRFRRDGTRIRGMSGDPGVNRRDIVPLRDAYVFYRD